MRAKLLCGNGAIPRRHRSLVFVRVVFVALIVLSFDTPGDTSAAGTKDDEASPRALLLPATRSVTHRWLAFDSLATQLVVALARKSTDQGERMRLFDALIETRQTMIPTLYKARSFATTPQSPVERATLDAFWAALSPFVDMRDTWSHDAASGALGNDGRTADAPTLGELSRLRQLLEKYDNGGTRLRDERVNPELRRLFGFAQASSPVAQSTKYLSAATPRAPNASAFNHDRLLVPRLNRWLVDATNARAYVPLLDRLLAHATSGVLNSDRIDSTFQDIFAPLVRATAWQESCYRQFVDRAGQRVTLTSNAGAVGLMQVQPVVWRGFYDAESLRNDIGYNARAGAEILAHYFMRYALGRDEHLEPGGRNNLAAATYAAYNGGPAKSRRYRDPNAPPRARRVDADFAEKFRQILAGRRYAALGCFGLGTD